MQTSCWWYIQKQIIFLPETFDHRAPSEPMNMVNVPCIPPSVCPSRTTIPLWFIFTFSDNQLKFVGVMYSTMKKIRIEHGFARLNSRNCEFRYERIGLRCGLLKLHSLIIWLRNCLLQRFLLEYLNHIHLWWLSPQISCSDLPHADVIPNE